VPDSYKARNRALSVGSPLAGTHGYTAFDVIILALGSTPQPKDFPFCMTKDDRYSRSLAKVNTFTHTRFNKRNLRGFRANDPIHDYCLQVQLPGRA
jgi:hypothetical protein